MNDRALHTLSERDMLFAIVTSAIDLESLVDLDYRYRYVNPPYLKYWGKVESDIVGHTISELLGETVFRERVKPLMDRAMAGEPVSYFASLDFPGVGTRYTNVLYAPARNGAGEIFGVVVILKDIDELERAKSGLLTSQNINRITFDHAAIGIAHVGLKGEWLEVNLRLCEIVGYTREQLLPLTFQDITHPDDLADNLGYVQDLIDGRRQTFSREKRYIRANGETIWIDLTVSLVRDAAGSPLYLISFVQDIQARKMNQLALQEGRRALDEAMRQLEDKAIALERFVHVLSHDLREPLNTMANFTGLLAGEDSILEGSAGRKYLNYVQTGASRMKSLLDDLSQYVRLDQTERPFVTFSLTQIANAVLSDLLSQIDRSGARITINRLPEITGEPNLIRLVLQNLISNAIKFVEPGTAPVISIRDDSTADSGFRISVCDNGIGIDAAALAALFVPFSRLNQRRRYAGTGLGLAICKRIVDRHGGAIEVVSTPGAGTCFTITLPRQPNKGEPA